MKNKKVRKKKGYTDVALLIDGKEYGVHQIMHKDFFDKDYLFLLNAYAPPPCVAKVMSRLDRFYPERKHSYLHEVKTMFQHPWDKKVEIEIPVSLLTSSIMTLEDYLLRMGLLVEYSLRQGEEEMYLIMTLSIAKIYRTDVLNHHTDQYKEEKA